MYYILTNRRMEVDRNNRYFVNKLTCKVMPLPWEWHRQVIQRKQSFTTYYLCTTKKQLCQFCTIKRSVKWMKPLSVFTPVLALTMPYVLLIHNNRSCEHFRVCIILYMLTALYFMLNTLCMLKILCMLTTSWCIKILSYVIQICFGITRGRVLNGQFYTQRF